MMLQLNVETLDLWEAKNMYQYHMYSGVSIKYHPIDDTDGGTHTFRRMGIHLFNLFFMEIFVYSSFFSISRQSFQEWYGIFVSFLCCFLVEKNSAAAHEKKRKNKQQRKNDLFPEEKMNSCMCKRVQLPRQLTKKVNDCMSQQDLYSFFDAIKCAMTNAFKCPISSGSQFIKTLCVHNTLYKNVIACLCKCISKPRKKNTCQIFYLLVVNNAQSFMYCSVASLG